MGADQSSSEPATLYLQALDRLVGTESVSLRDPFWRTQLGDLLDPPATQWDQTQILHFLQASAAKLASNAATSGNLRSLLLVIAVQLENLPVTIRTVPESLLALLAVARVFLLHIISTCSWEQRSRILSLSPPLPSVAPVVVSRTATSSSSLASSSSTDNHSNEWSDGSRVAVMAAAGGFGGDFGAAPSSTSSTAPAVGGHTRTVSRSDSKDSKSELSEVRLDMSDMTSSLPSTTSTPSSANGSDTDTNGTSNGTDGLDFASLDSETDAAARFIRALIDACIDIDINDGTNDLHLEVINLLLVCLSTQMYSPPELEWSNPFLDRLMVLEPPKRAGQLLQTLLFNLLTRASSSSSSSSINGTSTNGSDTAASIADDPRTIAAISSSTSRPHGFLRRIRTGLVTVIKLPVVISVSIFRYLFPVKQPSNWLADRSALLFLILCHQGVRLPDPELDLDDDEDDAVAVPDHVSSSSATASASSRARVASVESQGSAEMRELYSRNIYRVVLAQLVDDQIDSDSVAEAQSLRLPFDRLYDALGAALPSEWATLVLYSLLHGNTSFREFVFAKSDLDVLALPLLETLYKQTDLKSNRVYMLLILLLILSQDASFGESMHTRLILKRVTWFRECPLTNISLGSLMIIVLLRTIQHNLAGPRDAYLHTNCLASLANTAPHASGLHPYAASRLVQLLDMLSRKYAKMSAMAAAAASIPSSLSSAVASDGSTISSSVASPLAMTSSDDSNDWMEFVRLVLEVIAACLQAPHLRSNIHLAYWLLHKQKILIPLSHHIRISDLVMNLQSMVNQFEVAIERAELSEKSVDSVLRIMEPVARAIAGRATGGISAANGGHTKFSYEEQDHSEEFFLPYVWRVIWQHQPLPFPSDGIVLFATATNNNSDTSSSSPNGSANGTTSEYDDPNYIDPAHAIGDHHPNGAYHNDDTKRWPSSSSSSSAAASSLASLRPPSVTTGGTPSINTPDITWPTPPPSPGYSPTSFARHVPSTSSNGLAIDIGSSISALHLDQQSLLTSYAQTHNLTVANIPLAGMTPPAAPSRA